MPRGRKKKLPSGMERILDNPELMRDPDGLGELAAVLAGLN